MGKKTRSSHPFVMGRPAEQSPDNLKVAEYKEDVKVRGEEMVLTQFPKRILELNAFLVDPRMQMKRMTEIHVDLGIPVPSSESEGDQPPSKRSRSAANTTTTPTLTQTSVNGTPVYLLPGGTVHSNSHVLELLLELKPMITRLVDDSNLLKMWISFLIPKIEDGNNFGVSIQEDTLSEVRAVESEAANFYDNISRYYTSRGKVLSKVAKYPHLNDYRQSVRELDEKEFVSLRLVATEVRNHYATLHDIIIKNLEKIKIPRSSHGMQAMY